VTASSSPPSTRPITSCTRSARTRRSCLAGTTSARCTCRSVIRSRSFQTDWIDILCVHWWDSTTSSQEMMDSLHILLEQGKVLYLGVSGAFVQLCKGRAFPPVGLFFRPLTLLLYPAHNRHSGVGRLRGESVRDRSRKESVRVLPRRACQTWEPLVSRHPDTLLKMHRPLERHAARL
jgi:hypothetical protein